METFDKHQKDALKKLMISSYIHDAKIQYTHFCPQKKSFTIKAVNNYYNIAYSLCFESVHALFYYSNNSAFGDSESILGVEIDEYNSQEYKHGFGKCYEDSLHITFQMFSLDELHVVSKTVTVYDTACNNSLQQGKRHRLIIEVKRAQRTVPCVSTGYESIHIWFYDE